MSFKRKSADDDDEFDDNDYDDIEEEMEEELEPVDEPDSKRARGSGDTGLEFDTDDTNLGDTNRWRRETAPVIDTQAQSLALQVVDCDYYSGRPLDPATWPQMKGAKDGAVPIVRMFGVTESGHSILVHVHCFTPYFYVQAPPNFTEEDCGLFRSALNNALLASNPNLTKDGSKDLVHHVTIVKKASIYGFKNNTLVDFLQIYVALPKFVPTCKRILSEQGLPLERFNSPNSSTRKFAPTYESNLPFALRLMVDLDIPGAGWVELPVGKYKMRSSTQRRGPEAFVSTCQMEADVVYDDLIVHGTQEKDWLKLAPLRILSFDIECAGRKGKFPEPEIDPVISIGCVLSLQGQTEPLARVIFQLNTCANIPGVAVYSFADETSLLTSWRRFVIHSDPDLLIGYNIVNFDLWYLIKRAAALKIDEFCLLSRLRDCRSKVSEKTFQSKAFGKRENKDINIEGRVQFDMYVAIQREYKLRSYTLNAVSAHFLGQQKEDVHHSIITDLQNGTAETRRRLAVYCLRDAQLPQLLLDKLMMLINSVEMARVTGVPLSYLLTRGQQIKVVSQIYRKAKTLNLVIPVMSRGGMEETFEGATVIEPIRGFYDEPIATLDFASLYPSIMMAHNLCYSTLLTQSQARELPADAYVRTPTGACFIKSHVRRGVLPDILDELIKARAQARKDLKEASDPFTKAVLNGRQLALKISANSVYGFTGATVGQLPCLEISSSVTAFGRDMIHKTAALVEEKYTIANGYQHNAKVVYGDTDSVMVRFGEQSVEESMRLGREAAAEVSKQFERPISLEFEKVYFPYLLMNKKRYAGLMWTEPNKWSKMDAKGIETVRRDNCSLVKDVVETCLQKILIERSVQGALDYTKSMIADLLQNKLDLSLLVITKALGKSADSSEYSNKQAHVELAERMRQRDAASAPVVGDRVAYVIIKGAKNAPAYERAEDPIYVLENSIPIDTAYYLHQQLENPLTRIFEPVLGDCKSLLAGDHTRTVKVTTPTVGSLFKFAKVQLRCVGCKAPLKESGKKSVCPDCTEREPELYVKYVNEVRDLETVFSKAWTQCQRCQGSLHQDVLCANRDCPIFYRRKKVQKELTEAAATLERFSLEF